MAYLRAYRMASTMGAAGDPAFSFKRAFKIPKKLRKLKLGRVAASVAGSVIPGVGPLISAFGSRAPAAAAPAAVAAGGMSPELLGLFMQLRALGIPVGDPVLPFLPGLIGAATRVLPGLGAIGAQVGKFLPAILGGAASGIAAGGLGALIGRGGGARAGGGSRRMNVGNVRALRRSMRRVEGFAKLARSTISFTKQTRMKAKGRKR